MQIYDLPDPQDRVVSNVFEGIDHLLSVVCFPTDIVLDTTLDGKRTDDVTRYKNDRDCHPSSFMYQTSLCIRLDRLAILDLLKSNQCQGYAIAAPF